MATSTPPLLTWLQVGSSITLSRLVALDCFYYISSLRNGSKTSRLSLYSYFDFASFVISVLFLSFSAVFVFVLIFIERLWSFIKGSNL